MADPWAVVSEAPAGNPWSVISEKPVEEGYADKVKRTGEAFQKEAPNTLAGVGKTAIAAGEVFGNMATGIAGDIAGAATSLVTQDPKKGEAVKDSLTYQPRTEAGKKAGEFIGALTEPAAKAFEYIPNKLKESGHPIAGQVAQAVEDVAPIKAPEALGAARSAVKPLAEGVAKAGEAKAATQQLAGAAKNDLISETRKLGLKLTSQDVGAPIGKRVEAVASRPQLEREISLDNASKVKEAAAKDVGIKEPLSTGSINKAITETLVPYTAPRSLGRVNLAADTKWKEELKGITGTTAQEELDFPDDINHQVAEEVKKFDRPSADADSMAKKIAKLRERASDNFGGDADHKALARAQRRIATAMEEAIERHGESIGKTGVIKAFRDARVRLAKLYSIRDAMTETGELDLGVLRDELNKGAPMTGNLLTLARAKSAFDRSFQAPEKIRGHPIGAGDIALGLIAGGGKGAAAGGIAGMGVGALAAGARPLTRAVMASTPYQKAFIKAHGAKPSLSARVARKIAGPDDQATLKDMPKSRPQQRRKHTLKELERAVGDDQ